MKKIIITETQLKNLIKRRSLNENEDNKQVSDRTKQTIEKWIENLGYRGAAKKLVDYYIGKMTGGLSTDDLGDTTIFADGLDEIEDLLKNPNDYYSALKTAKETAESMLDDEGFGGDMFSEGEKKPMGKRRSLKEIDINPEADEIDFEDLQAAGDMYDRLKSSARDEYMLSNPHEIEPEYVENEIGRMMSKNKPSGNKLNVDVVGGKFVDPEDIHKMNHPKGMESDLEEYGTEETFENIDFGLNLNEGQIKLRKTFNKFMKNPIIKNLGDTL